jgi:hypothetical protein
MNFVEACKQIGNKRIKRKDWLCTEYGFNEEGYLTNYNNGRPLCVLLIKEDLDAEDWEVVEE